MDTLPANFSDMTKRPMQTDGPLDRKVDSYKSGIADLQDMLPQMVEAYHDFTGHCFEAGALGAKEKQLIALGISMFVNNEICTAYHVQEALSCGATAKEIAETAAVAAAVGSGHVFSQGATRVKQALAECGVRLQ